jgi:WD40 repeat protein
MTHAKQIVTIVVLHLTSLAPVRAEFGDILLEIDRVGTSVAVSDHYVLLGSPTRRTVYAYDLPTGASLADIKLDADVPGFGGTLAIDGSIALVGGNDVNAAYLFDVGSGELLHTLVPDDPRPDQAFGSALAIDGGIALVGAPRDSELQNLGGSVYVFDIQTGKQLRKITPDVQYPRRGLIPLFGGALALENGIAVIGESNSEVIDGSAIGGAYLFDAESGRQLRKLENPFTPDTHDLFSSSVDLDSGRVIIGVSGTDEACPGLGQSCWSGAAFIFDLESGDFIRKLILADGQRFDQFGAAAALDGDVAIVAGRNAAENAYFFDVSSGNELLRIPAGDAFAVANGRAAVVGRRQTYIVDIVPEPSAIVLLCIGVLSVIPRNQRCTRRRQSPQINENTIDCDTTTGPRN